MKTKYDYLMEADSKRRKTVRTIHEIFPIAEFIQDKFPYIEVELSSDLDLVFVSVRHGINSFYDGLKYLEYIISLEGDVTYSYDDDSAMYRAFRFNFVVLLLYPGKSASCKRVKTTTESYIFECN